jgi:hypothetical protein
MSVTLTVQQRAQRCRCGRYLAWSTAEHATCFGCMRPSEAWPCAPTEDPVEGDHSLDLQQVAEPEGEDPACE